MCTVLVQCFFYGSFVGFDIALRASGVVWVFDHRKRGFTALLWCLVAAY